MAFKLCIDDDIKAISKGDFQASTSYDQLLNETIISAVGTFFADYCRRPDFDLKSRTEYFSLGEDQTLIFLSSPPIAISPLIQVWQDTALPRTYGSGTLLVAGTDYIVHEDHGYIEKIGEWAKGPNTVKVTYSGGILTADASDPTLKLAAMIQVKMIFDRREELGLTGRSMEGGSVNLMQFLTLPAQVTMMLSGYRNLGRC